MKIHTIPTGRAVGGEIDVPDTVPALRYWRYINRLPDTYGSMAELSFYAGGSDEPMKGRVIGSEGSWENNSAWKRENLFDGDVLTSYNAINLWQCYQKRPWPVMCYKLEPTLTDHGY